MITQREAHARVTLALEGWLEDRAIYMSPSKRKELIRLILRIVDETYADGYHQGKEDANTALKVETSH